KFADLTLTGTGNVQLEFYVTGYDQFPVISEQISLVESGYYAVISHSGGGGTCAINPITITVYNAANAVATDFEGSITITAAPGTGQWSNLGGVGSFSNGTPNDGIATYQFSENDNGQVTLGFSAG